jgi:cytochrome P450
MDMTQKILSSGRDAFPKRGDAVDEMAVIFGDQGILVTEGEQWLRQRKMCMPAFRHEQLVAMVDGMNVDAREAAAHLATLAEVYAFMSRAAFANVCMAAFDHRIDAFAEEASGQLHLVAILMVRIIPHHGPALNEKTTTYVAEIASARSHPAANRASHHPW